MIAGEADIFVAGGVESISCVQNQANRHMITDPNMLERKPDVYMPMLQTAEVVARRYGISREAMDHYGARSQQRACAAAAAGKFKDEIVPITTRMAAPDKHTGMIVTKEVTLTDDEGRREGTTYESICGIRPAVPGGPPYWGRLARLTPLERVLVQFAELIDRLAVQGVDVSAERTELAALRRQAMLGRSAGGQG